MHMEIRSILNNLIDEQGLKKGYVAKAAEINPATLTAILKGAIPTLPVALRIAEVMGKRVDEIWIWEKKTPVIKATEEI
jgi:putative transcriptional regulator